jgi:hypothetical protein
LVEAVEDILDALAVSAAQHHPSLHQLYRLLPRRGDLPYIGRRDGHGLPDDIARAVDVPSILIGKLVRNLNLADRDLLLGNSVRREEL